MTSLGTRASVALIDAGSPEASAILKSSRQSAMIVFPYASIKLRRLALGFGRQATTLYRLNVFPITVPPLRQRPDDIPPLVGHLVQKHCRKLGGAEPPIPQATMKALQAREWPGNIRELENVVERALISSRGTRFEIGDEPVLAAAAGPDDRESSGRARTLAQLEHDHVVATLERLQWRIEGPGGAADVLGINASTLRSRMRKHGIRRPGGHSAGRSPAAEEGTRFHSGGCSGRLASCMRNMHTPMHEDDPASGRRPLLAAEEGPGES